MHDVGITRNLAPVLPRPCICLSQLSQIRLATIKLQNVQKKKDRLYLEIRNIIERPKKNLWAAKETRAKTIQRGANQKKAAPPGKTSIRVWGLKLGAQKGGSTNSCFNFLWLVSHTKIKMATSSVAMRHLSGMVHATRGGVVAAGRRFAAGMVGFAVHSFL